MSDEREKKIITDNGSNLHQQSNHYPIDHTSVTHAQVAASLIQLPHKAAHHWIHELEHQMIKCGTAHFVMRSKEALTELGVHLMKAEAEGSTHVFRDAVASTAGTVGTDIYAEGVLRRMITTMHPAAGTLAHLASQFCLTAALLSWRIASPYMEEEADRRRQRTVEFLRDRNPNFYTSIIAEDMYENAAQLKALAILPRLPELTALGVTRCVSYASETCLNGLESLKQAAQKLLSKVGSSLRNLEPKIKKNYVDPVEFRRTLTESMAEHFIEVNNTYQLTDIQQALYAGYLEYHIDQQLKQDVILQHFNGQ